MTEQVMPDLAESDDLLSELFTEVTKWESNLAGGQKLGRGASAIQDLQETKVTFGNPRNDLIKLTEDLFRVSGTKLNAIYKQQMQSQFNFYYLSINVNLRPKPGVRFWRLTCELDFGPKGENEPIITTIFPTHKWLPIMSADIKINIGLDGDLDWKVGVDSSKIAQFLQNLPGDLKANVVSNNDLKAHLAISAEKYEWGRPDILAEGEGSATAFWRIQDDNVQKKGTMKFGTVFKVPQGTESINLTGKTYADVNINWLTDHISDIILGRLPEALLKPLQAPPAENKFVRGDGESWELKLL